MISRETLLKAEKGDSIAMIEVAKYYLENGRNSLAFYFSLSSAKKGNVEAMNMVGRLYYLGIGTETNFKKANRWFKKAKSKDSVQALVELGNSKRLGSGIKQDKKGALKLFKKAAQFGNGEAHYELGLCFMNGDGAKKNRELARYHLTRSAIAGCSLARFELNNDLFIDKTCV